MPRLNRQQMQEFLSSGRHLMKLGTLTPEGWPSIIPVWYHYDGESFLLAARSKARWLVNIEGDPRVSALVDTCEAPYTRVIVRGEAEIADRSWLGDWQPWAIRYLGEETDQRYYDETKHIPRVLVRIAPREITTWAGPGWHPRYAE